MTAGVPTPPAPDGADTDLAAICAETGLPADDRQREGMATYLALLQRWNAVYNLTAVRDPQAMRTQHLADCLAAVAALARRPEVDRAARILDVGSGGGLPGVLLALFRPAGRVTCIDAVAKKAAFVRQVAGALSLDNLDARHGRVEALLPAGSAGGGFDLITARAFSSLADLIRLSRHLLCPGGCWMAMKGHVPDDEIAALPGDIEAFHVEPLHVPGLQAQRCLVWMRPRRNAEPA